MENLRIGVVDDHRLFRQAFVNTLRICRWKVTLEAEHGHDLLAKLKHTEAPDIIFTDLDMPAMGGLELMPKVLEKYPAVRFIVVSMHEEVHRINEAIEAGARGYISKNAEVEEINIAIEEVAQHEYYFNTMASNAQLSKLVKQSHQAPPEIINSLDSRERTFLQLLCADLNYVQMGVRMNISDRTVEKIREGLMKKTGVRSTIGLALYAERNGLV